MKVHRILPLILGISFSTFTFFASDVKTAINDSVTEEDYELLKENSLKFAKTNVLSDKTLTADSYLTENELVVTVESLKAKIIAKIHLSDYSWNVDNGTLIFQRTAEFENVKYEEVNKVRPLWQCIMYPIVGGVVVSIMFYLLLI